MDQRFSNPMNAMFGGGVQHSEVISVPDKMVGLSEYKSFQVLNTVLDTNKEDH